MSDEDDLRLNTLHRFAKQSPRLILHEYSHCEVPAGCGGVVLRWLSPDQGRPGEIRLSIGRARSTVWLDGTQLDSSLCVFTPGGHVVAVHLRRGDAPNVQPFTFAARYDRPDRSDLLARGNPIWRATAAPPPATWTSPDFDDRAWPAARYATDDELRALDKWPRELYERERSRGVPIFALDSPELWLRVSFTVYGEQP